MNGMTGENKHVGQYHGTAIEVKITLITVTFTCHIFLSNMQ